MWEVGGRGDERVRGEQEGRQWRRMKEGETKGKEDRKREDEKEGYEGQGERERKEE